MSTENPAAGSGDKRSALEELRSLRIERAPAPVVAPGGAARWGRRFVTLLLLAALVGGALVAAGWYRERMQPPPETMVVTATGGPETVLTGSGYVNADVIVIVGVTFPGRLAEVLVEKGDQVKKGQLLAKVEDDQLRAELSLARAQLARDLRNLERQEALARSSANTAEALDNARSAVDADKATVALAEAKLRQARVLSPIDGKVLERLVEPGVIVTPTNSIGVFKLADMSKAVVEVDVSEGELAKLQIGQPADVVLDAYPDKPYRGRLQEFAQLADRAKATVQVKVRLDDPDEKVRPNMSAKVTFRPQGGGGAPARPRLLVPASVRLPGQQAVYVLVGDRIERREVKLHEDRGSGMLEVAQGLSAGERVVVKGQEKLHPGQTISMKRE